MDAPHKDEDPAGRPGLQVLTQSKSDQSISDDGQRKALARLTAELALRGYELHELKDGSLMVSRWNLSKALTFEAAKDFAHRAGAI